jgi:hypothetical protein
MLELPRMLVQGRHVAHKPESLTAGVHHCSQQCLQNIPLQACGNICGVIALVMAAISCRDPNLWRSGFLSRQTNLPEQIQWLRYPTRYGSYLRMVLIQWLTATTIDVKLLGITSLIQTWRLSSCHANHLYWRMRT